MGGKRAPLVSVFPFPADTRGPRRPCEPCPDLLDEATAVDGFGGQQAGRDEAVAAEIHVAGAPPQARSYRRSSRDYSASAAATTTERKVAILGVTCEEQMKVVFSGCRIEDIVSGSPLGAEMFSLDEFFGV
ncbi:hypothetical protein OsJ_11969 [Oryza sativa Japonica Group]|uniref:Uncharacterized protein n=1 Tax=Oryza sativa subsp. japonica TaxID=39947 RepID=B9FA49_ORYSJ|nr:hypothetical protein OsJ_11969 [Oryza sativa Japonica Group]